jgi:hypothetical protein
MKTEQITIMSLPCFGMFRKLCRLLNVWEHPTNVTAFHYDELCGNPKKQSTGLSSLRVVLWRGGGMDICIADDF